MTVRVGAETTVAVADTERIIRELTDEVAQRQHALDRYQSLVEASGAAVWTRDADGAARHDAPAYRAITGQSPAEYLGRGFLDAAHPAHRDGLIAAWRAAAGSDPPQLFTRDYRLRVADGTFRWFRTRGVPVHAAGRVIEWVGTETDIDDAMRARDRLEVLAQATLGMNAARDPEAELVALAEAAVPKFADMCRIYLVDPRPQLRPAAERLSAVRAITRYAPGLPPQPTDGDRLAFGPDHPIGRCLLTAAPVLVDMPDVQAPGWRRTPAQQQWIELIAVNAELVAPVLVGGVVVAALLFLGCADRPPYTEDDRALVTELATRASVAVATATEFQQNRQTSMALQNAMLSEPPCYPGVEIEARYQPAVAELQVGGDWYDAFVLPGGDLAVGVGDVAGHDLPAAVAMGQLRSILRGLAHDSGAPPAEVLGRLDRVSTGLAVTGLTTLVYGRLSRSGSGVRFCWSNAGHPPPVLIDPHGEARLLTGPIDVVLGVAPGRARHEQVVDIEEGWTLLLHTDGLVERRCDVDDRATADLRDLVRTGTGLSLGEFCDHLIRHSTADTGDDMVVLALRVVAQ